MWVRGKAKQKHSLTFYAFGQTRSKCSSSSTFLKSQPRQSLSMYGTPFHAPSTTSSYELPHQNRARTDAPPTPWGTQERVPSRRQRKKKRSQGTLPNSQHQRGTGACWSSGIRLGRGTSYSLTRTCIKTNHKVVSPHSGSLLVLGQATGNTDSLDSPRPGLGGSHHLPPYSVLYASPPHLHLNGTFSRDSQSGVPKLSRFGLPGLWAFITSHPNLRSGQCLKQTCNSP